jgi:hypothetical protein
MAVAVVEEIVRSAALAGHVAYLVEVPLSARQNLVVASTFESRTS